MYRKFPFFPGVCDKIFLLKFQFLNLRNHPRLQRGWMRLAFVTRCRKCGIAAHHCRRQLSSHLLIYSFNHLLIPCHFPYLCSSN
jgi:hypothetical protein